ncbi:hypothetical protein ACFP6A_00150 [Quadrisphaera sp. GCM10027208]|uniref:hypothetical protein n=1 Tax=Quadrisphaera sp. GCM10027208 TaxID=3273423 RepID=UPI003621142B
MHPPTSWVEPDHEVGFARLLDALGTGAPSVAEDTVGLASVVRALRVTLTARAATRGAHA